MLSAFCFANAKQGTPKYLTMFRAFTSLKVLISKQQSVQLR
jgi:hypothetical protein